MLEMAASERIIVMYLQRTKMLYIIILLHVFYKTTDQFTGGFWLNDSNCLELYYIRNIHSQQEGFQSPVFQIFTISLILSRNVHKLSNSRQSPTLFLFKTIIWIWIPQMQSEKRAFD